MKATLIILSLIFAFSSRHKDLEIETVRKNYSSAASNEMLCEEMIKELQKNKDENVYLGYLGGFQTVWANHVFNPISKLNTFNEGKKNIEIAIKKDPQNIELRFIRLSVQINAPSFLGYNAQKLEDESFLIQNKKNIESVVLLKMVNELLKQ